MSLTKVSYSMIQGAPVNILDFGADPTGTTDSTSAIEAAQQSSKAVYCPPGTYKVTGLRIYDQVNLIGAGYENTVFVQNDPDQPAINCLSDATTGQLLSIRLENFGVTGHASATVAAVKIEALGVYAIYRSHFDMIIQNSYQALNMQANTANNVFYCTFCINVVATETTAVILNGGVYNTYDFFIAGPGNGKAIEHAGFNNTFIRLVTEGQISCSGQNTVFINPTIEELPVAPPTAVGIVLSGFNQTLISPTIVLNSTNSSKIDYCIKPFYSSSIINPRFIVQGTLNPFATTLGFHWALQGPGASTCANKMEVVYDGSTAEQDLQTVSLIGDVIQFTNAACVYAGNNIQYSAPTGPISLLIKNNTDVMIVEPTINPISVINVSIGPTNCVYKNGQTLQFKTTSAITTIAWNAQNGADTSAFPTSMTANQIITAVYRKTNNKWYLI